MTTSPPPPSRRPRQVVIGATCPIHGAVPGMAHLSVTLLRNGLIEFDPHVHGRCALLLDKAAARTLYEAIGTWLG